MIDILKYEGISRSGHLFDHFVAENHMKINISKFLSWFLLQLHVHTEYQNEWSGLNLRMNC